MAEFGIPRTLTTPAGTLTFNDFGSSSYFRLSAVDGGESGAIRTSVERIPQRDGALVRDAFEGELTEVWQGQIVAASVTARREMEDTLRACLKSLMRGDGTATWTPSGATARQRTVRLQEKLLIRGGFLKEFQFSLVSADPYAYSTALEFQDSSPVLTGGMTGPGPFFWHITATSGGDALITNDGTAPSYPTVRLYGPFTHAVIQNTSTGKLVSLQGLPAGLIGVGDYAEIDMRQETIYKNGDTSQPLLRYLDNGTTEFWSLRPGVEDTIDFQATGGITVDTKATVFWRAAYDG
jgi:hypothetical protein